LATFPTAIYKDASRIAKDFHVLVPPINSWRYRVDADNVGRGQGWEKAGFDDHAWKITDPTVDTFADLGLFDYYGDVWYRATVQVPAVPADRKTYLWISMADDRCRLYVNGQPVLYITSKGETLPTADGYLTPFSFDITEVLKSGAANQITLLTTRTILNEIGTGGLLGPVYLYHEKQD
jgi:beta-galactosidase/beta-glucuronidase